MTTTEPPIGLALQAAASAIERWSTRQDTRRRLHNGPFEPLSTTERWLLAKIARTGPVRLSKLADWQRVDRSTMTTQVRRLEQLQYLTRGPDPTDGRASLVSLSEIGREQYEELQASAGELFDGLVADWPANERRQFARLLTKFAATLDDPPAGD